MSDGPEGHNGKPVQISRDPFHLVEARGMNPVCQVRVRHSSFVSCKGLRFTCWGLAAMVLVGAVLTLNCGGGAAAPAQAEAVQVSLTPQSGQVALLGQIQFSATVSGSTAGVSWSVSGAAGGGATVGVIDASGLYTAPTILPSPNTVTVTATSVADTTKSATASVTILNPAPTVASVSPATIVVGSADTKVTVTGTGFTPQSVVGVGGVALATLYWNPTVATATIPAAQLANAGNQPVQVTTPAPGGGTSSTVTLTVLLAGSSLTATGNPQVALYSYGTPRAASMYVQFGTDTTYGLNTWTESTPTAGGTISILVAGMRANTTYHMRAVVTFADGTQFIDTDHTFTTGGLPSTRVPQTTVTNPNGLSPSPGVILLHLAAGASNQVEAAAVDNAGNLIWYYDYDSSLGIPYPMKLLSNGHMLINIGTTTAGGLLREIDLAGNVIRELSLAGLNSYLYAAGYTPDITAMHHDFLSLPNGHLILLVYHARNFTDLPGYPGTTAVVGDALVDLDQNYNPVWVWDSFDHLCASNATSPCLDINRHPLGLPDWTHSNAVIYSPDDGNLMLSMRDQGWVLKIDYENGQGQGDILWRLGYQGDFTISTGQPADWFYAQHYVNLLSPNSTGVFDLTVFDNGDNRVLDTVGNVCGATGQPACYSRVPIFQIDDAAMTATLLWQDNLAPVYSFWGGSVQQLGDSNIVFDITTPSDDPNGARYLEVTSAPTPEVVLQMEITGQNAYRAVHLPSLYPGVQW